MGPRGLFKTKQQQGESSRVLRPSGRRPNASQAYFVQASFKRLTLPSSEKPKQPLLTSLVPSDILLIGTGAQQEGIAQNGQPAKQEIISVGRCSGAAEPRIENQPPILLSEHASLL